MAALEQRRQKDMLEEQERRRKMKEEAKRGNKQGAAGNKQVKKFDLARERPNVMVSVANALQAANVLVNSMRVSAFTGVVVRLGFGCANSARDEAPMGRSLRESGLCL